MKQLPPTPPKYLRHKTKGQAYVYLRDAHGKRRQEYLGPYGSPESHRKYRELVASHFSSDACLDEGQPDGQEDRVPIAELCARFLHHAEGYYRRPDGTPTGEFDNLVFALRPLLKLYRDEAASDFGPLKFKRVREQMIDDGLARTTINYRVGKIRSVFRWGAENELVSVTVFQALQAVSGLKRGRSHARETSRVLPVCEDEFRAVLPFLNRHVRAIAELQWLTGARSSELLSMTTETIDRGEQVWIYRPEHHKTEHHGKERVVALGPQSRKVLRQFLRLDGGFLFQPKEAECERRREQRRQRKSEVQPSQHERAKRAKENPKRRFHETYSVGNYRQQIQRACAKAGVQRWTPHQLRHSAATRIRSEFGLDVSRAVLGHSSTPVTELYAERDLSLVCKVVERLG